MQLKLLLLTTLYGLLSKLITGKFMKKLLLSIVSPLVRKTKNKVDDELLSAAKEDLGIEEKEKKKR
jgi:hypothetical protein